MKFHPDKTLPENGEIFVFGSNLAGHHGAGAAKVAYKTFGAEYGIGWGEAGQSYAIPTKDENIRTLPLARIYSDVLLFLNFATDNPDLEFFVTRIGCGLAGYKDSEIAPMFVAAPDNCSFPEPWRKFLIS